MSLSVAALEYLAERGLSLAEVIEFARISDTPKDRTGAERAARYRARKAAERDDDDVTRDVTRDAVTEPPLSRPPNEEKSNPPTHTPGNIHTRAREAEPFPRPEWCPDQLWRDLKSNRKLKRMACTPTAHSRLLSDIAKYTNDEWPPGRVLEAAVARGWAAVPNDPRDPENDRPAHRSTNLRPAPVTARGDRPNPCLDMLYAAEAEIRASEDPQPDFGTRPALRAIGSG